MCLREITTRNQHGEELQLRRVEEGPHPPRGVRFNGKHLNVAPRNQRHQRLYDPQCRPCPITPQARLPWLSAPNWLKRPRPSTGNTRQGSSETNPYSTPSPWNPPPPRPVGNLPGHHCLRERRKHHPPQQGSQGAQRTGNPFQRTGIPAAPHAGHRLQGRVPHAAGSEGRRTLRRG